MRLSSLITAVWGTKAVDPAVQKLRWKEWKMDFFRIQCRFREKIAYWFPSTLVKWERLPCPHQFLMSGVCLSLCRLMFLEFWLNRLNCFWWAMTWRGHASAALNNYYLLWFEIYEFQTLQMCAVCSLVIRYYSILGHMTLVHSLKIIIIINFLNEKNY